MDPVLFPMITKSRSVVAIQANQMLERRLTKQKEMCLPRQKNRNEIPFQIRAQFAQPSNASNAPSLLPL